MKRKTIIGIAAGGALLLLIGVLLFLFLPSRSLAPAIAPSEGESQPSEAAIASSEPLASLDTPTSSQTGASIPDTPSSNTQTESVASSRSEATLSSGSPSRVKKTANLSAGVARLELTLNEPMEIPYQVSPAGIATKIDVPSGLYLENKTVVPMGNAPSSGTITIQVTESGYETKSLQIPFTVSFPESGNASSETGSSAFADEVFRLTNEQRVQNSLPPLTRMAFLDEGAATRSTEIAASFSHTRPDGSSFYTVFGTEEGKNYNYGENIAYGYPTPADVVNGWMNSPGHRANILNTGYTGLGIGVYSAGGVYYWVQIFYQGTT